VGGAAQAGPLRMDITRVSGYGPAHAAAVGHHLAARRLAPPWRRLDVVATTGSTNADLLARSGDGEDIDGVVLLAEHHSAGRGRHGRTWSAPPGGADRDVGRRERRGCAAGRVGLAAAAHRRGLVDAVRRPCGIAAGLKWPNDVMVGTGKLAGVLVEVAAPEPAIVVGLGLNVTLTRDETPYPATTTLSMLESPVTDRNVLLDSILRQLGTRVPQWRAGHGPDAARSPTITCAVTHWAPRCGRACPGDRQIVGIGRDVDDLGRLCIDTDNDTVTISACDITHLRPRVTNRSLIALLSK
jgi:BirA family transcriptional regulator, biotin operon repressor / biotin---[acetyl-CoA-carboxylase] ligase